MIYLKKCIIYPKNVLRTFSGSNRQKIRTCSPTQHQPSKHYTFLYKKKKGKECKFLNGIILKKFKTLFLNTNMM